jgi:hypothetical protein
LDMVRQRIKKVTDLLKSLSRDEFKKMYGSVNSVIVASFYNTNYTLFEIGFDEIFLMELFQFLPNDKVKELRGIDSNLYIPTNASKFGSNYWNGFSIEPVSNEYKTKYLFYKEKEKIYYSPTIATGNSAAISLFESLFTKSFF